MLVQKDMQVAVTETLSPNAKTALMLGNSGNHFG